MLPHNKLPTTPNLLPIKIFPALPIAQLFLFNNQEKLNNAPCHAHCPQPGHPTTGRATVNCPPSSAAMPHYSGRAPSPLATARLPSPNESSANLRPCGRAEGNRSPASKATLLFNTLSSKYFAHKNKESLFLLLMNLYSTIRKS